MILKILLNLPMICKMSVKVLRSTTQGKNIKVLMFDDMIADINSNKKLNPTITELFTSTRKLIISLVFTTQL